MTGHHARPCPRRECGPGYCHLRYVGEHCPRSAYGAWALSSALYVAAVLAYAAPYASPRTRTAARALAVAVHRWGAL